MSRHPVAVPQRENDPVSDLDASDPDVQAHLREEARIETYRERVSEKLSRDAGISRAEAEGIAAFENAAARADPAPGQTRSDLRGEVVSWMQDVNDKMGQLSATDKADLRTRFTQIATDALKFLGDDRDAELASQPPRTEIYRSVGTAPETQRGSEVAPIREQNRDIFLKSLAHEAGDIGLKAEVLEKRLARGAANALEERDWVRADVAAAAKTNGLNFDDPAERNQAARLVDRFYDTAAGLLATAHGRDVEGPGDRLRRTLADMSKIAAEQDKVQFDTGDAAKAFAEDMKARYGEAVMEDLARGRTERLGADFADPKMRANIARAIAAAGAVHEEISVPRREVGRDREKQTDPRETAILHGIATEVRQLRAEGYSRAYISERSLEIEKTVEARIDRDAQAKERDQDRER